MTLKLREHQIEAIQALRQSLARGKRRPMLAAATSFGKTIVAGAMCESAVQRGKRALFVMDRVKLTDQTIEKFDQMGLEFGVIQGQHERYNIDAPIQIASVQTLARRRWKPEFDFAIVDEAHTMYKSLTDLMEAYNKIPFIGLSATPYSKGLGDVYDDLIVPITQRELLDKQWLCPVKYYGGRSVDTSKIKSRAIKTGGSDFDPKAVASAAEGDEKLNGDIVKNWIKHGENAQTIAFCPSIDQSKWLVEEFQRVGVPAAHIDGYMDQEVRNQLYAAHDAGEFKILSCSQLLNTGYDAPTVRCLIDCYPTKSIIAYVQRVGRIMRIAEGKEYAIYLDHAGNVKRHGFAEDIVPDSLHCGEHQFKERGQTKEKKEPKTKDCPSCSAIMVGIKCGACGHEMTFSHRLEHDGEELAEIKGGTAAQKRNRHDDPKAKASFYGQLKTHAEAKGYKPGWAAMKYKDYYGVWPNKYKDAPNVPLSASTKRWILSQQIRYAKGRAAA